MYADNFEKEGYTELDFIASMKMAVSLSCTYELIMLCSAGNF